MQKNTNHAGYGNSLLPSQFSESTDLEALIASLIGDTTYGAQELEEVLWDLLTKRFLAGATGAQLDVIGVHLGQPRESASDTEYRATLYAKIGINTSQGDAERLIYILNAIAHPTWIRLRDAPPACVVAHLFNPTTVAVISRIQKAAMGGVRVRVHTSSDNPFRFGYDRDATGATFGSVLAYGKGYGEVGATGIGGEYSEAFGD
jgi:hypothetical protein